MIDQTMKVNLHVYNITSKYQKMDYAKSMNKLFEAFVEKYCGHVYLNLELKTILTSVQHNEAKQ